MKYLVRFFLLLIAFQLMYCSTKTTYTIDENSNIDSSIRSELKIVEDTFLKNIKEKKYDDANLLLLKLNHNKQQEVNQYYDTINSMLKNCELSTRDDYYINSISIKGSAKNLILINSNKLKQNLNFNFEAFEPLSNEMFITLQKYSSSKVDYLLTLIYIKDNNKWKINQFNLGVIAINKLDAKNWMEISQVHLNNNELFNAYFCAAISNALRKPFPLVIYTEDMQIQTSYKTITDRISKEYELPFTVNSIKSKPQLFRVQVIIESFGAVPIIQYKSNIRLTDISSLKKEGDELAVYIKKVNPSIKKYFELIVFRAYSKIPESTDSNNYFYGIPVIL